MAQSTSPFLLNDQVEFTLQLVDDGSVPGTPTPGQVTEFQCQLNRAEIVPATSGGAGANSTYVTFCADFSAGAAGSATTFTVELSNFQAWADVQDLSNFLWDNDGALANFTLRPTGTAVSVATPEFTGEVTLQATNVGGTANSYAVSTVSLPCTSKPTKVTV